MRKCQLAVRNDAEVLHFKLVDGAWKSCEEVLEILLVGVEANLLTRREHVENK